MHRRDKETRYIISNKGFQGDLYSMAELQSRSQLSVHCPYSKVRQKLSSSPKFCVIRPLIWAIFSYDLPDDVFLPGEIKPTRPKKKTSKKRDLDAMDVRPLLPSLVDMFAATLRRLPSINC